MDPKNLHRKVLESDLRKWSDADLTLSTDILHDKDADVTFQLEELADSHPDDLDEEDLDWEFRARDARKYIRLAQGRVRKEIRRREIESLNPEQKDTYLRLMENAKRMAKETEGCVKKLKAARKVANYALTLEMLPGEVREAAVAVLGEAK